MKTSPNLPMFSDLRVVRYEKRITQVSLHGMRNVVDVSKVLHDFINIEDLIIYISNS